MNRTRSFLLLAVVALAACKPHNPTTEPTAPKAQPQSAAPSPARPRLAQAGDRPTLSVPTVDGRTFDLGAQRGKWVLVNNWATWCAPCLKEMPDLSALAAMRQDIRVVGLANDDIPPAELKAFLEKHPVVYPVAQVDPMQPPAGFGPVEVLPVTWLLAPDGTVAKVFAGPVTAAVVEQAIAALGKSAP